MSVPLSGYQGGPHGRAVIKVSRELMQEMKLEGATFEGIKRILFLPEDVRVVGAKIDTDDRDLQGNWRTKLYFIKGPSVPGGGECVQVQPVYTTMTVDCGTRLTKFDSWGKVTPWPHPWTEQAEMV
jgi:hypothetical protein